jgi:hypothetical protein
MADMLLELQDNLKADPVSSFFWDKAIAKCKDEQKSELNEIINKCLQLYNNVPVIKESSSKLRLIIYYFPSFALRLSTEIAKNKALVEVARNLHSASLAVQISKEELHDNLFNPFFDTCVRSLSLKDMNKHLEDNPDKPAQISSMINQDFTTYNGYPFSPSASKHLLSLVEYSYFFEVTSKYFLRYFFELISRAPSDLIAQHVDFIFSKLFITLKMQETAYWKQSSRGLKLREQLEFIIHKDLPNRRHPVLRRWIFESLNVFNPLVKTSANFIGIKNEALVTKRFDNDLLNLSEVRLSIFLKHLLALKGSGVVIFLLGRLESKSSTTIPSLVTYLRKKNSPSLNKLSELIDAFLDSLENRPSPQHSALQTTPTQLHTAALKNLKKKQKEKTMTAADVAGYLKSRLEKRLKSASLEGALTQHNLANYLERFASSTKNLLVSDHVEAKDAQVVVKSAGNILQEIAQEGNLGVKHITGTMEKIHQTAKKLTTDNKVQRIALVGEIGEDLAMSSLQMESKKETKKGLDKLHKIKQVDTVSGETASLIRVEATGSKVVMKSIPYDQNDDFQALIQRRLVPIDLEKKATFIPIKSFFAFPFGEGQDIPEEKIFDHHIKYLELVADMELMDRAIVRQIKNNIHRFEKRRYRKYFNIFPKNRFDVTILLAVHSIWQNNALDALVIEA